MVLPTFDQVFNVNEMQILKTVFDLLQLGNENWDEEEDKQQSVQENAAAGQALEESKTMTFGQP